MQCEYKKGLSIMNNPFLYYWEFREPLDSIIFGKTFTGMLYFLPFTFCTSICFRL